MLCIQDPSYENSIYLHETLLTECLDSLNGAGAYAFATKDGIDLIFGDNNFKDFLKNGIYTLVVGTDDITNEHAINTLIKFQKKYKGHLQVKAYVHDAKGSTFHPKFSWFKKQNGGVLVLGSGNLTQKGLRHNREIYTVVQQSKKEINEVIETWDSWYAHSAPFLFDIDDPIVMTKAKQNSAKNFAVSSAKASVKKELKLKQEEPELSNLYKKQPKDIHHSKKKEDNNIDVGQERKDGLIDISSPAIDEDFDIDFSYWKFDRDASVLVAELPGKENSRMGQANFSKEVFRNYFGAREKEDGKSYRILLKYVDVDGNLGETEIRPAVISTSHNFRFELKGAKDMVTGANGRRTIAIFVKVANRDFMYTLLSSTHDDYDNVLSLLPTKRKDNECRRVNFSIDEIYKATPKLKIWSRLEKEEKE